MACVWARRHGACNSPVYNRLRGLLVLMYGVLVLVMAVLPYLGGWRGSPLVALVRGNLYHGMAALVGSAGAWLFRSAIRRRLREST